MFNWLHHLFNPHCEHCREERNDAKVCDSCETLRAELAIVRFEKQELLKNIIQMANPEKVIRPVDNEIRVPIKNALTWRARKQILETEDLQKARIEREKAQERVEGAKPIEELEAELGVAESANK